MGNFALFGPPDCVIETASHDQRFSVTHIKSLDGAAMERLLEDCKEVSLQAGLPLLHRVTEEEKVVSECHQELILGADGEGEDVIPFHSVPLNHPWREDNLLGRLESDLFSIGEGLLDHPHRVVAVAADEPAAKGDQARDLPLYQLTILVCLSAIPD